MRWRGVPLVLAGVARYAGTSSMLYTQAAQNGDVFNVIYLGPQPQWSTCVTTHSSNELARKTRHHPSLAVDSRSSHAWILISVNQPVLKPDRPVPQLLMVVAQGQLYTDGPVHEVHKHRGTM